MNVSIKLAMNNLFLLIKRKCESLKVKPGLIGLHRRNLILMPGVNLSCFLVFDMPRLHVTAPMDCNTTRA